MLQELCSRTDNEPPLGIVMIAQLARFWYVELMHQSTHKTDATGHAEVEVCGDETQYELCYWRTKRPVCLSCKHDIELDSALL